MFDPVMETRGPSDNRVDVACEDGACAMNETPEVQAPTIIYAIILEEVTTDNENDEYAFLKKRYRLKVSELYDFIVLISLSLSVGGVSL